MIGTNEPLMLFFGQLELCPRFFGQRDNRSSAAVKVRIISQVLEHLPKLDFAQFGKL